MKSEAGIVANMVPRNCKASGSVARFSFGATAVPARAETVIIGGLLIGVFAAHVAFYRFAAADSASEAYKSRAISLVLAGGLVAAFAGPELAMHTREMFSPVLFAGGYAAIAIVATIKLGVLQFLQIPNPGAYATSFVSGRPLREILRQPVFLVAVLSAMVGYGAMNFVMVSTPLAMVACAHPFETAAFVIQWHVVGMYAPSFFTVATIAIAA